MKFAKNIDWLSRHERTFSKIKKVQQQKISNETGFVVKKAQSSPDVSGKKFKSIQGLLWLFSCCSFLFVILAVKARLFRRGVKKDFMCDGSFQEAIAPVLVLAQVFALMPISGITSKSAHHLSFSLKYYRTIYSFFVIICFGICTGFTVYYALGQQFDFDSVETIIFYTSIFLISVFFFNLARKWPELMTEWEIVERKLPPLRSQFEKRSLAHQIKMITFVASLLSLAEHILSMLSAIYYANACPARPDPIDSYLFSNFIQIFAFVDYNIWLGIFGKYLNILSTFAWNFTDIFIMTISVGLSSRFRQLNADLFDMARKPTTESFWINSRVNYRNLCKLCDKVDDSVSSITLLGFSNNLYFICGKIMKSIQKKPSLAHTLYFWFSLLYLLGRTLAISLYSADIHEESRRPMQVFRAVPRESWCKEIKRFSQEVSTDVVALSGMKFFHLTRGLVLSVAGTIVTYELVLLQFNKAEEISDCH